MMKCLMSQIFLGPLIENVYKHICPGTRGSIVCEDLRWPHLTFEVRGQLKGAIMSHGWPMGYERENHHFFNYTMNYKIFNHHHHHYGGDASSDEEAFASKACG